MVTSLPFDQEVPASTPGSFLGFFCNGELLHGMNVLIVLLVTSDIKGGGLFMKQERRNSQLRRLHMKLE